jgi:hypothetical protein
MTPTRLSKIARLPAPIREELNHRLHDGELSRTILPWINELPETKRLTTELYRGKPITHQNLSEWRHTGYQDWLFHQQRLEWNGRLAEEEAEATEQNRCEDGYEAMGFQFLYDLSQARKAMQKIKNPNQRWDRLETLTREFCRLQNAFNWSRRVGLEFDKFELAHPFDNSVQPEEALTVVSHPILGAPAHVAPKHREGGSRSQELETQTNEASATDTSSFCILPSASPEPKRQGAGALQDASRGPEASAERASVLDCGSPLPLSEENSNPPQLLAAPDTGGAAVLESQANTETNADEITEPPTSSLSNSKTPNLANPLSKLLTSSTPTPFAPVPPLAPTIPPPRSFKNAHIPMRGRRFVCIEG